MVSNVDTNSMDVDTADRKRKQDGASSGVSPKLKKHYSVTSTPDFELGTISEIDLPTRNMIMNCVADCLLIVSLMKLSYRKFHRHS